MNKPDWKCAPEWANWIAQDQCSESIGLDHFWVWFENRPTKMLNGWIDMTPGGKWKQTSVVATDEQWKKTLEARPSC